MDDQRERYEGGQTITIPVTIDSIPLFVRGGSIIPMALNQINNVTTETITGLHLLIAADKDHTFTLYEDDGCSMDYEKGVYLKTSITMTAGEQTILDFKQEGSFKTTAETMYLDVIQRDKAPFFVTLDGELLPHHLHRKKFEKAESGWYYSQTLKSVQIKYPNPKKDSRLLISFEQFDMIGM